MLKVSRLDPRPGWATVSAAFTLRGGDGVVGDHGKGPSLAQSAYQRECVPTTSYSLAKDAATTRPARCSALSLVRASTLGVGWRTKSRHKAYGNFLRCSSRRGKILVENQVTPQGVWKLQARNGLADVEDDVENQVTPQGVWKRPPNSVVPNLGVVENQITPQGVWKPQPDLTIAVLLGPETRSRHKAYRGITD